MYLTSAVCIVYTSHGYYLRAVFISLGTPDYLSVVSNRRNVVVSTQNLHIQYAVHVFNTCCLVCETPNRTGVANIHS